MSSRICSGTGHEDNRRKRIENVLNKQGAYRIDGAGAIACDVTFKRIGICQIIEGHKKLIV